MTKIEKRFVNRRKKAEHNIVKLRTVLENINIETVREVLEIGCGIGLVSAWLADEYGWRVYGTDFDPDEIKLAQEYNQMASGLQFQIEDASNLSFENNRFDLLISQNVFHHIPDWQIAIKEVARVLKPGGWLIWNDIVMPAFVKNLFKPMTRNYGLYTIADIQAVFETNSLNIIQKDKRIHGPFAHYALLMQSAGLS